MTEFESKQAMLVSEFTLYVLDHPEFGRKIPDRAHIVFQLDGHKRFNTWARRIGERNHQEGRRLVIVHVKDIARRSRLVRPKIESIAA